MRVGAVSARDAAITLLALTTGVRACDIVGMRMGDIDWRRRTIGIVQQKTGNPLRLPLPALLMAKLADYVLGERPSSGDDHLFLRSVAPHTRLADHASVHRVTVTTFQKAGWPKPRPGPGGCATTLRRGCWPRRCADHVGRPASAGEPVYERRPGPSARMRPAGPGVRS